MLAKVPCPLTQTWKAACNSSSNDTLYKSWLIKIEVASGVSSLPLTSGLEYKNMYTQVHEQVDML